MSPNCAHLVAYLNLFCNGRYFILSDSDNNQADVIEAIVIEAINSTSRYLNDLRNNDNPFFGKNGRSDMSNWASVIY